VPQAFDVLLAALTRGHAGVMMELVWRARTSSVVTWSACFLTQ